MKSLIHFQKEFKKEKYVVTVLKTKDVFVSVYISDYLFFDSMLNHNMIKNFRMHEGKPSEHDLTEILPYLKVVKISKQKQEQMFKNIIEVD